MCVGNGLRIQDSLYGIVELDECERAVVDSPAFQRLLSVKQLGFAYAVFPGADYSRFSHCIGACHVMQKLLAALDAYGDRKPEAGDEVYRLAALLHDVGHYPFSHTTEHAIERRYIPDLTSSDEAIPFLSHEQVGGLLLELDKPLRKAVGKFSPDEVARVFSAKDPDTLTGLISSDIDADRLDYLMRTAHHTGLPYGKIDQEYIVREVRVDSQQRLCWTPRALPALDHLLLSRSYDYQQVAYNKTVAALELLLSDIVYALTDPGLGGKGLDLSRSGVQKMIEKGTWYEFDDHMLFETIKASKELKTGDVGFKEKCEALLGRCPPRRIAEVAELSNASLESAFDKLVRDIEDNWLPDFAKTHGIDRSLWWVWSSKRPFTAYKGIALPEEDDESALKLTRIWSSDGSSRLAVLDPQSTIGDLCTTWRFCIRIYALIPKNHKKRNAICEDVQAKLGEHWAKSGGRTIHP